MEPVVLEGPPCEACGKPINDLAMGLIVWGRCIRGLDEPRFDGAYFFHKGPCDPGPLIYSASHEIAIIADARELLFVETELAARAANSAVGGEHWSSTVKTILWLQTIAIQLAAMRVSAGDPLNAPTGHAIEQTVEAERWPGGRARPHAA